MKVQLKLKMTPYCPKLHKSYSSKNCCRKSTLWMRL